MRFKVESLGRVLDEEVAAAIEAATARARPAAKREVVADVASV
jgi:hypothetical protein